MPGSRGHAENPEGLGGNVFLQREFPRLDVIHRATIVRQAQGHRPVAAPGFINRRSKNCPVAVVTVFQLRNSRQLGTPSVALLIFVLLTLRFGSARLGFLVLFNLPCALMGGVIALWMAGLYESVPASALSATTGSTPAAHGLGPFPSAGQVPFER